MMHLGSLTMQHLADQLDAELSALRHQTPAERELWSWARGGHRLAWHELRAVVWRLRSDFERLRGAPHHLRPRPTPAEIELARRFGIEL